MNKIYKYYHAIAENITEIIPNQNGDFGCNILYVDKINYPELKKILNQFKDIKPSNNISVILADKNADISRFNLPEYDDEKISVKISNLVEVCISNVLYKQPIQYQEACTMLLVWIRSNVQVAKKYFPAYESTETQMKLLTTDAVVKQYEKSRKLDEIYEAVGYEDVSKVISLLKQNKDDNKINLINYADEIGVCFSTNDFPENYSYEQFHKFIHEIGKSGEKAVFEYIQNDIINLGYSVLSKKDNLIVFNKNENTIQVNMPDTTNYHQSGWDICVTVYQNQEIIDFHYIEVKTHTENSIYSNSVKLSASQMSMAFKNKEHYHVAFAVAEKKSTNIIKINFYTNIPQLLADDSIKLNNSVNELIIIG